MKKDYYKTLGVPYNATPEQIKAAYRDLVKRCHPDTSGIDSETEKAFKEAMFKEIQEAYSVLSVASKRAKYDKDNNIISLAGIAAATPSGSVSAVAPGTGLAGSKTASSVPGATPSRTVSAVAPGTGLAGSTGSKTASSVPGATVKYASPAHKKKKFSWKKAAAAAVVAAALVGSGWVLSELFNRDKDAIQPTTIVAGLDGESEDAKEVVLNPDWSFNPNSAEEMKNRIADFILDARAKGQEIPVDKAIDLYLFLNIDELTPAFLGELNYQAKTEESISRSVEFVGNILKEDTMTSRPDTIINVSNLVASEKDSSSLMKMQALIADWNAADKEGKKVLADELNAYVNDVYLTDKCREYDYTTNVLALTFLRGMEIMSINSGAPIPAKDVANILYYDGSSFCLELDPEGKSKYSQEWTVAKEVMEKKLSMVVYTAEGDLGYRTEYAIMSIVDESNVVLGVNPDINEERDKNDTTVYQNEIDNAKPLDRNTDKVVKDPSTGKDIVVQPQTPEKKQEEKQQIEQKIEEENKVNTEQAQKDAQAGADAGFKDGFGNGQVSNAKANNSGKSQAYIDGYNTAYAMGVAELQKFLADQKAPEEIIKEEFTPVTPIVPETKQAPVTEAPIIETPTQEQNNQNDNSNNGNIDLLPGFHYGPDGKIYDENGNEVEIITQTSSIDGKSVKMTNLVALRNEALALNGMVLQYQVPNTVAQDITSEKSKSLGIKI